jgi:hypothetical protein
MDDPGLLREFGLRKFSSPCSCNPSKCRISEEGDLSPCVLADGRFGFTSGLQVFGLREFVNVVLGNLPECYGPVVTWQARCHMMSRLLMCHENGLVTQPNDLE